MVPTTSLRDPRFVAGRLGGWMFIGGALISIPSSLVMKPTPDPALYLLTMLGVGTGVVCLRLPWERWAYGALHAIPVVATIEIAIVIATFDQLYGYFYPLIMVFAALIATSRRELVPQFLLLSVAILCPLLYEPAEETREGLYLGTLPDPCRGHGRAHGDPVAGAARAQYARGRAARRRGRRHRGSHPQDARPGLPSEDPAAGVEHRRDQAGPSRRLARRGRPHKPRGRRGLRVGAKPRAFRAWHRPNVPYTPL